MLVNLSNHPSEQWDHKQLQSAIEKYGSIVDVQFPKVEAYADSDEVFNLAIKYLALCSNLAKPNENVPFAVHIAGELCFVFHFVTLAKAANVNCICSTTERIVTEIKNIRTSTFNFIRFRKYF